MRFSAPYVDTPMHMRPPALGAYRAGTFGLFLLPEGRPRCFAPKLEDPAAVEEAKGSMAQERCLMRE
jgi:hypothetical protein